ncbi:MAG: exosome complex RNA-binding protein Csl4 [Candidatus Hermodarchaeota archaeon]|nr:exosome complex RNA-binding protein Csl4 [Candidatus Hermodarchaeota archaeon]
MTTQRIKEGDSVLPGERLGVIEEFLPGEGTFQDEDDVVYASITGIVHIDMKERKISVEATTRTPVYPKRNDVVLGEIQHVTKKSAIVNIFQIEDEPCPISFSGYLFIKNSAGGYIEQMRDIFAPGDLIIARVQHQADGLARLSTVGPRFGVFHASCSRCGGPLHKHGQRLECMECGNLEERKLSQRYGKVLRPDLSEDDLPPEE